MLPSISTRGGVRHTRIHGLTGWDSFLWSIGLHKILRKRVAAIIARRFGKPTGIPGDQTFELLDGVIYEILDDKGSHKLFIKDENK